MIQWHTLFSFTFLVLVATCRSVGDPWPAPSREEVRWNSAAQALFELWAAAPGDPYHTPLVADEHGLYQIVLEIPGLNSSRRPDPPAEQPLAPTPTGPPPATSPTPTVEPSQVRANILPAPLYFLDGFTGQITRLEMDGLTRTQISYEPQRVTDFDVSPVDGRLVYVSGNRLLEIDAMGQQRRVKLIGPAHDPNSPYQNPAQQIKSPRFSPDGQHIAVGFYGINLIPVGANTQAQMIQPSDPFSVTTGGMISGRYYLPKSWSPDSKRLLLDAIYYWEGSALVIKRVDNGLSGELIDIEHLHCCGTAWTNDSTSIFIASPVLENGAPGLWRVDANDGQRGIALVGSYPPQYQRPFLSVDHPYQTGDGSLLAFVDRTTETYPPRLVMHRIQTDGDERPTLVPLRKDSYLLWDVHWASDGSGAVIVERAGPDAPTYNDPLFWLPTDGSAAVRLPATGWQPRWGVASPLPPLEGLRAQAAADLGATGSNEEAIDVLAFGAVRQGQLNQPFWVAHTVGRRTLASEAKRRLGIYARSGNGWRLLDQIELAEPEKTDRAASQNELTDHLITQVMMAPDRLWLQIGVVSSPPTYYLLSFDGVKLKSEVVRVGVDPVRSYPAISMAIALLNYCSAHAPLTIFAWYVAHRP